MSSADFFVVLPEVFLAAYALAALVWGVYANPNRAGPFLFWLTSAVLFLVGIWVGFGSDETREAFGGSFVDDSLSRFGKSLLLFASAVVLLAGRDYLRREGAESFEFPVLTALAAVGMMVMVSASDLMVLYVGIELQSLSLYVLAAFERSKSRSTEAGLKYFVLGALSSGLLLYGASLVYGFAGTTLFSGIAAVAEASGAGMGLLYGLVFMAVGMAFKVSAAPFHMWAPDVYEGAPTPATALLATAPKVAAMVLFARLLAEAFGAAAEDWRDIVAFLSAFSMLLGAVAAIGQRNIKRLMAYSSIAHIGFALMGVAAWSEQGLQAMLIYMAIYVVMNIGVFAFILSMRQDGRPVTDIGALAMYSRKAPLRAVALLVLLFSLAGIPPLVGFFAKFYVFVAAVEAGMVWLAVVGAVASVVGAFYYLRIVYYMYFGEEREALDDKMPKFAAGVLVASAAAMVAGVFNLFGVPELAIAASLPVFN